MAKTLQFACRKCRLVGEKLFLKGERCFSPKCSFTRRSYRPGQHGQKPLRQSEYAVQLREKQKLKWIYGINEQQLKNYYQKAVKQKGLIGQVLLETLERRLDNVVFRLGFALSRRQARKLIVQGHFLLNGRKVTVPSILTKVGDKISVKEKSKKMNLFSDLAKRSKNLPMPSWLSLDPKNLEGKIIAMPKREELGINVNEQMVVEFYSK
jgi:small subunit ribosomal protein S4